MTCMKGKNDAASRFAPRDVTSAAVLLCSFRFFHGLQCVFMNATGARMEMWL